MCLLHVEGQAKGLCVCGAGFTGFAEQFGILIHFHLCVLAYSVLGIGVGHIQVHIFSQIFSTRSTLCSPMVFVGIKKKK